MVPIRPRGAIELEFFEVLETIESEEPNDEDIAEWAKKETVAEAETKAKMKTLNQEKTRLIMRQAVQKQKMGEIIEQMLIHEAELAGKSKPTDEEIRMSQEKAIASANLTARRNMLTAMSYAAPLVMESQRIYAAVEKNVQRTKERGKQLILEESKASLKELQDVFGLKDMEKVDTHLLHNFDIPSLAALCASALAPAQMRLIYCLNYTLIAFSIVFVSLDFLVLAIDWHSPCMNIPEREPPAGSNWHAWVNMWWQDALHNKVYMWFLIDFGVHLCCAIVRAPVVRRFGTLITTTGTVHLDSEPGDEFEVILNLKKLYEYYTTSGTTALVELDMALTSYMLFLANWSIFFDVCWLLYGTDVVWNTPWTECTTLGLVILRCRITLFQLLCLFYLLQLVFFIIGQLLQTEGFTDKVIHQADKFDQALGLALPIGKVLCHALCVRQGSDLIAIQLNMQKRERERLQGKKEKAQAALDALTRSCDNTEQVIVSLENQKLDVGNGWTDEAEMQAHYDAMHSKIVEDSTQFAKQVVQRSVKATKSAEDRLDAWERGEGQDGELFQAFAQGEGFEKMSEMVGEATETQQHLVQTGIAQAQAAAADSAVLADAGRAAPAVGNAAQPKAVAGLLAVAAAATSSAGGAAGGAAPAAKATAVLPPAAKAATVPPALRRTSQADGGAGPAGDDGAGPPAGDEFAETY